MRGETPAPINRGAITISIMLAPIMQGVDTTIANVALPHMQGSLSVAQHQTAAAGAVRGELSLCSLTRFSA